MHAFIAAFRQRDGLPTYTGLRGVGCYRVHGVWRCQGMIIRTLSHACRIIDKFHYFAYRGQIAAEFIIIIPMLKKMMLFLTVAVLLMPLSALAWGAKKITVKTIPENATIWVDGQAVGEGVYTVKFEKNNDFYIVTAKAPGYMGKRFRLLKSNPNKTVVIRLNVDEAFEASSSNGDGEDMANGWMDITCRKGFTEDQVWKRLMNIATSYFPNIEVRDKAAGWIKTGWRVTKFTHQTVRTRLEVRMSFTDDDAISYRARVVSEIKDNECEGKNCYESFDRVLKVFEPMIDELQTSVGGGE